MRKNGFAERLKALLEQKKLTLAQVAKAVNTSAPSVHRWAHGGEIEYENLRALADFLEVNWIWLRYGDDALASAQEVLPNQNAMADMRREYLSQIMESEARMKMALEMSHVVSWEWNALTGTLIFNSNAEAVFGQSPESIREHLLPFAALKLEELIEVFKDDQPYTWDFSLGEGAQEQWFASRGKLLFDSLQRPLKVLAVTGDITARKKTERALERSEYMMRKIIETIPVGLWAADEMGTICLSNPEVERIWGGAKYVGLDNYGEYRGWWERTGQEVGPTGWTLARAVKYGEASSGEVVKIEAFDGELRTIIMHATPLFDAQNKIIGAIEVNQDITDLKRIEYSLKESLAEWEAVYEQGFFGVIQFDESGEIIRANSKFCELIGREVNEIVGARMDALFAEETLEALLNNEANVTEGVNAISKRGVMALPAGNSGNNIQQTALDIYVMNKRNKDHAGKRIAFVFRS